MGHDVTDVSDVTLAAPHFITEQARNRAVTLFGPIQNGEVSAPSPGSSLTCPTFFFREGKDGRRSRCAVIIGGGDLIVTREC